MATGLTADEDLFSVKTSMVFEFKKPLTAEQADTAASQVLARVSDSDVASVEFQFPAMTVKKDVGELDGGLVKRLISTYVPSAEQSAAASAAR